MKNVSNKIKEIGITTARTVLFLLLMGVMLVLFIGGGYLAITSLIKGFIDILLCSLGVAMFIFSVWFVTIVLKDFKG